MKFSNRIYKWSKPFSSVCHEWSLLGPRAALSFHVSVRGGDFKERMDFHYFTPPEYMEDSPPSHINCLYTGGRCWHDRTSLYAMKIWPTIECFLESGDHESIFRILEKDLEKYIKIAWGDAQ